MTDESQTSYEFPQEATLVAALESARVTAGTDLTVRNRTLAGTDRGQPVLVCQGEFGTIQIELTPATAAGLSSRLSVVARRAADDPGEGV